MSTTYVFLLEILGFTSRIQQYSQTFSLAAINDQQLGVFMVRSLHFFQSHIHDHTPTCYTHFTRVANDILPPTGAQLSAGTKVHQADCATACDVVSAILARLIKYNLL